MRTGYFRRIAVSLLIAPLACLAFGAAQAQKIPRAEQATSRLEFLGFARAGETIEVGQGDIVWSETVRHADTVRILVELPVRKQPSFTAGAPAGAILSGYRVAGGTVYCAAPDPVRANKEAQCLRDLDGDGLFDASQIVEWTKAGDEAFSAFLKHLAPVSKGPYEALARTQAQGMPASVVFHDFQNGVPRFKLTVNGRTLPEPIACVREDRGACSLFGVSLQAASGNGRLRVTFLSAASERVFDPYRMAYTR